MTYQSHYDILLDFNLGGSVAHNELVKQQNSNKRLFLPIIP
jgi:hypothetical protein